MSALVMNGPGPGPTMPDAAGPERGRGTVLNGRYLLSREIGRGATGTVWDADDLARDQPVAVKILHASLLSSPAARARFHREVRSAQVLDHPNVVRVTGRGQTEDGGEFLVMERLRGRTLSALFAEAAPLPQLRAMRIVSQILDAMDAAHGEHIVHRDLKPGNVVLIDAGGTSDFVKVCDFGLAKLVDPEDSEDDGTGSGERSGGPPITTGHGELCGTPEYMAPEQARGERLDGRADLYSIAVILFQAVVGRVPFQGRTPFAVVGQHLGSPPPRPTALRPDLEIAPALEGLILRGLAKDRRERPSSARVFRADLLQIERDLMRDHRRRSERRNAVVDAETLPAGPDTGRHRRVDMARVARPAAMMVALAGIALTTLWVASSSGRRVSPHSQRAEGSVPSVRRVSPTVPGPVPAASGTPMVPAIPAVAVVARGAAPSGGDVAGAARPSRRPGPARLSARRDLASPRDLAIARSDSKSVAGVVSPLALPASASSTQSASEPEGPASQTSHPPADSESLLRRAEDLLAEGHVTKACTVGEAAAAADLSSAAAHGFLGRCYTRAGRLDEARTNYRTYLSLAPHADDAPFVRAIVDGRRP